MIWLIAIGCLALGIIVGALAAAYLSGTPARIKELESQVKGLEERHDQYKDDVSDHFNVTADLIQQMTQSYRDVYQHLATGAQDLCSAEVANKLLPVGTDAVFETVSPREEALGFTPPKDYATRESPDQKGALAEDFGLDKTQPEEEPEQAQADDEEVPDEQVDEEPSGEASQDDESAWKVTELNPESSRQQESGAGEDESGPAQPEEEDNNESPADDLTESESEEEDDDGNKRELTGSEEDNISEESETEQSETEESEEHKSK